MDNVSLPEWLVLDLNTALGRHYIQSTGQDDFGELYLTEKGKKILSNTKLNESNSMLTLTPQEKQQIEDWVSILDDRRSVGPKRYKALASLIDLAKEKSGKDIRSKREALLALDWIEPSLYESKKIKELRRLIREEISNMSKSKLVFNNFEEWNQAREALPASDDDKNWSKDSEGKLIAFWDEETEGGWIKK